ncbi:MAG: family 78 glycoside hydrolase catalytic domain [Firmicutes bacterium]|nr:family 78 glycoside hydrolase catalytic domain [Bacillota bacterium]
MTFDRLYCNGNTDPLGVGKEILLSWNYLADGKRNEIQNAFRIEVMDNEKTVFDSSVTEGETMTFQLSDYFSPKEGKEYTWRVTAYSDGEATVSHKARFETAIESFRGAKWLICPDESINSPVFFRSFSLDTAPVKARAYVTGLGFTDCSCNGSSCSDRLLAPPNTLYDKFCYFETYDITNFLKPGENIFSIQLGKGYNNEFSQFGYRYYGKMGCRCLLSFTYTDGKTDFIISDNNFSGVSSPIASNGIYSGEVFDASISDFKKFEVIADEDASPKGKLIPDEMPPICVIAEYFPINSWETDNGVVFDFGCNLQGVTSIEIEGEKGCAIKISHSEMIHPDGTPDPETNRAAKAEDVYICGSGRGSYTPKFTYHGFRYALVSGLDKTSYFRIRALQISASLESTGSFSCSDAAINRIHKLCRHSMLCNFVSIPTDCPVRDERTPCQMDSQMIEAAAIYNFNMYSYYKKWLRDITNTPFRNGEENPDWHGDYIMLAFRLYRFYGDTNAVRELYPKMKDDVLNWFNNSEDGIWTKGFGDWCLPNDNTWENIGECKMAVNTSLLFAYCCIMEHLAGVFGIESDEKLFESCKRTIRESFYRKYYNPDGSINTGRQPEMILPLYFGLIEGERRIKTGDALCRKIREDGCLDTGGFGTMALIPAAAFSGGIDLLPDILKRGEYPGFGYWLATGATSLWEQWAVKGVMHSHSHELFAGIDAAFYRVFAGITALTPAFRSFRIAPCMPSDMQFCECKIKTMSGTVAFKAEKLYGGLELTVTIPPNTSAVLEIPKWEKFDDCGMWEGERRIEKKPVLTLGSGTYNLRLVPERCVNGIS